MSTRVSLKCAGWLPQDGTFESELASGSRVERHPLCDNVIAHSPVAGHSGTLADPRGCSSGQLWVGQSGMTAGDQHQPVLGRSRRWRSRGVSGGRRMRSNEYGGAGWRVGPEPGPLVGPDPSGGEARLRAGSGCGGARRLQPVGDGRAGCRSWSPRLECDCLLRSTHWALTRRRRRWCARLIGASRRFRRPIRTLSK